MSNPRNWNLSVTSRFTGSQTINLAKDSRLVIFPFLSPYAKVDVFDVFSWYFYVLSSWWLQTSTIYNNQNPRLPNPIHTIFEGESRVPP